jgi:hypothetical protein
MTYLAAPMTYIAMAVLPPNAPLGERVEILKKYLTPAPGEVVEIDAAQVRDKGAVAGDPGKLYGEIRVSPPKGACFTVTVDPDRRDIEVCKPRTLKFRLEELDRETASVTWVIKTGPGDFGTPVRWTTPYTIAKVLPTEADFYRMNSRPVFFKSCVAQSARENGRSRQVVLTKFDNTKWYLRFPERDEPIKIEQPPPAPIAEPAKKDAAAEAKPADEKTGDEKKPDDKKSGEKIPEEKKPEIEQWSMNSGRGFEMNVGNLITDGSMPPGKQGTCRYVYDAKPGDFSVGRVECHHTDQYLYVHMYLKCMGPITPK